MDERNKKLAEWAGVEKQRVGVPDHKLMFRECYPNFTESLDACFKWLEPKLSNYNMCKGLEPGKPVFGQHIAEVWSLTHGYSKAYSKEPALAFCLAIEKLMDGKAAPDSPPQRSRAKSKGV